MTYAIGDPAHINLGHNELVALIQEQADLMGITVTLPDSAGLGDTGHVDDHNLIVAALQTIADEATGAATVSGTTGSPTTTSITGYTVYNWSGNGTFTLATDGLVEYLVQGGGGGSSANYGAGGGNTRFGTVFLVAGTYTVTVGAAGTTSPSGDGGTSEIVGVAKCLGGVRGGATVWGQGAKGGTGDLFGGGGGSVGNGSGGTGGDGVTSSITGTSLEYGAGGDYPGPAAGARGGGASGAAAGGAGGVIIRVAV